MSAPLAARSAPLSMSLRPRRAHVALWAVVCTLLIKPLVPLLASTAAHMRDQPVAEICSVYGVTVAQPADKNPQQANPTDGARPVPEQGTHSTAAHGGGGHCALSALAFLAGTDAPSPGWLAVSPADAPATPRFDAIADAVSRWVATMKQGPPVRA